MALCDLGQNLRQLCESEGVKNTSLKLRKLLKEGKLKPEQFSVRELAEAFCGHAWVRRLHEGNLARYGDMDVLEAGEGVDVSAFSNITGQLVFSKIHEGWGEVQRIGDQLFTTVPTDLAQEKVPGVQLIGKEGEDIHPGQPYPEAGFGEHYWDTPRTTKQGEIVSVTKEAVYFDRTALILKRAAEVGERLAYRKEKKQLACFAGISVKLGGNKTFNGNNHVWMGDSFNNYSTSNQTGSTSGKIIYANALASNELVDWTDLENLWFLFTEQLHPDTGNPIEMQPSTLVTMPYKLATATRITRATQVRHGDADATSAVLTYSDSPSFVRQVISSALLYQLIVAAGESSTKAKQWYFYGDPKKAFEYRENWPLTVVQAPANNEAEFERDIVARWKASERGVPWCAKPQYMTKGYDTTDL